MKMTGAELIIRLLERQGITTVAGIPGGAILPLYDALGASTQIRHVLTRHEQGAGFIAQGMARASGQAAVCLASSGPGATNLITAIADARLDSIPVVCITGQVPSAMIGTDAFQEVDTYGLTVPITKHNFLVDSVEELLDVVPRAFRIALSGRPGPVLIDVPKDIQNATIEFDEWPQPGCAEPAPQPADTALAAALALIAQAQRPILYLGGGVVHAGAAPLARELAETAGLPTVMTLMALGTLPETHLLQLGMLGMHGARCTNLALAECDLLIAVGARFDDRATGKVAEFCPNAAIVHIDIDASELDKIKTAHVALNGDVREVLGRLLPRLGAQADRRAWLARIGELKRDFPLKLDGRHNPRHHYGLIRATARAAGPAAIVTTDVGQH
ncbi:MAG TPA: thiamine pyrophosphate-binding protein, partial [Plasticicumulans sp.]|nr:thiamine pyrophosphate-binding protein [Plasticicumulans sp.]